MNKIETEELKKSAGLFEQATVLREEVRKGQSGEEGSFKGEGSQMGQADWAVVGNKR